MTRSDPALRVYPGEISHPLCEGCERRFLAWYAALPPAHKAEIAQRRLATLPTVGEA